MAGKRIYELTEKSGLENDYFFALDKSGTANAQKVNVSKILNPINNISGSADEYSSTKAYAVGDLVIHDNKLYKCTTACSAAAWSTNQGYFTQSTLTTELTNVKSSLSDKVNTSDIVNNLTSTATNVPLSAAQGKALKDTLGFTLGSDYIKFDNGLLIQWGSGSTTSNTYYVKTLSVAFKDTSYSVAIGTTDNSTQLWQVNVSTKYTTQIHFRGYYGTTAGVGIEFNWIAIGKWK